MKNVKCNRSMQNPKHVQVKYSNLFCLFTFCLLDHFSAKISLQCYRQQNAIFCLVIFQQAGQDAR
jgi:hypothetical protein